MARYLVDRLPWAADDRFTRVEQGIDVIEAPTVASKRGYLDSSQEAADCGYRRRDNTQRGLARSGTRGPYPDCPSR